MLYQFKKKEHKDISARRVLRKNTLALILALLILLLAFWGALFWYLQSEIYYLGTSSLNLIATDLKMQLDRTDSYLLSLQLDNAAFHRLGVREGELAVFDDTDTLKMEFVNQVYMCDALNALFVYSEANQMQYLSYGNLDAMPQMERLKFKKVVRESFSGEAVKKDTKNTWNYCQKGDFFLLYKTVKHKNVYCTAVFDLDLILQKYENQNLAYTLFFQKEEQKFSRETVSAQSAFYAEQSVGPLNVGLELKDRALSKYGKIWIIGLGICSVILIGVILLVWSRMNQRLLNPVNKLMETMEDIRRGKKEYGTGEDLECKEFIQLDETFNSMMQEIKNLQIEQYEKELETQRFKLLSLQSQIRPHFYLNCLKNLYALAEKEQYEGIKSAILALSNHFRYVFSANETKVELRRELNYLKNYVELYRYNFFRLILLQTEISEETLNFLIPPISLLTFLENSVKHGNKMVGALKIEISTRIIYVDGEQKLNLTFKDNGDGFSDEALKNLNKEELQFTDTGHVGIYNVVYRCRLLYPEGFYIAFWNDGGAVVDMYFPIAESMTQKEKAGEENRNEIVSGG